MLNRKVEQKHGEVLEKLGGTMLKFYQLKNKKCQLVAASVEKCSLSFEDGCKNIVLSQTRTNQLKFKNCGINIDSPILKPILHMTQCRDSMSHTESRASHWFCAAL